MVFLLHIWGPAFGLPSLDAHCLAAVAYLKQCLRHDEWALVPSDPNQNPLGELPALKDGEIWIGGFHNIVAYLRDRSAGQYDRDKDLSQTQLADRTAYTSFIDSRGQSLLDLSLYVSTENYTKCTRPALGDLLSWPDSWFVPHKLRDGAKKRSEHLGLSGLDVDTAQDEREEDSMTAQIPKSLRKPRLTVSSMLGRDMKRNKFRLDAVTADFFEPLEDMLGGKKWLIGDSMTSADCLALAYLALMRGPKGIAHSWLKDAMRSKYSDLNGWFEEKREVCFGLPVAHRFNLEDEKRNLPWTTSAQPTWQQIVNAAMLNVAEATPWLGAALDKQLLPADTSPRTPVRSKPVTRYASKQKAMSEIQGHRLLYSHLFGSSICVAITTGLLFWNGLLVLPSWPRGPKARSFGAAGAMLGLG